jgi:hypothetical protein
MLSYGWLPRGVKKAKWGKCSAAPCVEAEKKWGGEQGSTRRAKERRRGGGLGLGE